MLMPISNRIYDWAEQVLYRIALVWKCHQLPDRSFFVHGRQIPLCARCLGILLGPLFLPVYQIVADWRLSLLLIGLFFFDGTTQLFGFRTSNNKLRLLTGVGFSVAAASISIGVGEWLLSTKLQSFQMTALDLLKKRL
jgi:uncharacterized membrane protein